MLISVDFRKSVLLLENALRNRQIGGHDMNNRSSRSHCLTDIFIEIPAAQSEGPSNSTLYGYAVKGRISLVDLAGSEVSSLDAPHS